MFGVEALLLPRPPLLTAGEHGWLKPLAKRMARLTKDYLLNT